MTVHPYRTAGGHRNILRAVNLDDARHYLTEQCGHGVEFCAVDIPEGRLSEYDDAMIDGLLAHPDRLARNEVYVT